MRELKKRVVFAVAIILLLVAGVVGTHLLTRQETADGGSVSFRLKWLFLANYAESFVAREKGFWSERGLDVTVYPGGFENDSIKLVAAGSDQFGITGGDDLLIARSKGIPIVAVAAIYQDTPVAFFVASDSSIQEPKDFAGKKVGRKYGTNVDTQYLIMLHRAGIAESAITHVPVKFDLSPILTGQVDVYPGYAMGQPEDLRSQGFDIRVIRASEYGIKSYGNVLFTTERMIDEKPDAVRQFVGGYLQGLAYTIDHPDEAVEATLRYNDKLDRDVQGQVIRATLSFWQPASSFKPGMMDQKRWSETQSVLLDGAVLDAPVDLDAAFENGFVESYYAEK